MTSDARNFYDRYWKDQHIKRNAFDHHPGEWSDAGYEHHMRLFRPFIKGRILDFGCGDGQFVARAARDGFDICGVDVSQEAIDRAISRHPGIDARVMPGPIPFDSGAFDTITALDVMEHLMDVEGTLEEMNRVLRPGGVLLITTTEMTRAKLIAILLTSFHEYFYPASPHIRFFTRRNLAEILTLKGFTPLTYAANYRHFGIIPMGQFVAARKEGRGNG